MDSVLAIYNLYNSILCSGNKIGGCQILASELLAKTPDPRVASERLVKLTAVRSSCTGICTLFTEKSYIPICNELSDLEAFGTPGLQLRMVLTIAQMAGYSPYDEEVKAFLSAYYISSMAYEVVHPCVVSLGLTAAISLVNSIPGKSLAQINKKFFGGYRVFTKNGHSGHINLMALACIGGIVASATLDAGSTYAIGRAAIHTFFDNDIPIITAQVVE